MGWTAKFCVVVFLATATCSLSMGQTKPDIAFEIDFSEHSNGIPRYVFVTVSGVSPISGFSSDSKLLAVASGHKVTVWSVPEGEQIAELPHEDDEIRCVVFSPVDETLATRTGAGARVWRRCEEGWELADRMEDNPGIGGCFLAYSPDGRFLAWDATYTRENRTLRVWDLIEHRDAARIDLREHVKHIELLHYVGFTDDGQWLKTIAERRAGSGYAHEVRYWSTGTFEPGKAPLRVKLDSRRYRIPSQGGRVDGTALALSADGLLRAHMSPDGEFLELMDMATRKSVVYPRFLPAPPGLANFQVTPLGFESLGGCSLLFSPNKQLLAVDTTYTRFVLLWGVTRHAYTRLPQRDGHMWPVAFSPNGRYLFTLSSLMKPVEPEFRGTVWDLHRETRLSPAKGRYEHDRR